MKLTPYPRFSALTKPSASLEKSTTWLAADMPPTGLGAKSNSVARPAVRTNRANDINSS